MLTPYNDVPGVASFEWIVVIFGLIYAAYKCIISILTFNWTALKFFVPAIIIVFLIRTEGSSWPFYIQIPTIILFAYLLYKGSTSDYSNLSSFQDTDQDSEINQELEIKQELEVKQESGLKKEESKAYQEWSIITCPHCAQRLSVPKGKSLHVTCPKCKRQFEITT